MRDRRVTSAAAHGAGTPEPVDAASGGGSVQSTRAGRLSSIDQVRGLVIAVMALDHVRDFFTNPAVSPTDLAQTWPALFFTRWITHYCAPTFVFLAGTAAYLSASKLSRGELSVFLLKRGVWLALLEFTVVRFTWTLNFDYSKGLFLIVIWAIGASMVVLAALVWLPTGVIAGFGLLLVAAHNLLDPVTFAQLGVPETLWNVLHVPGRVPFGFVGYPLIPWVGVMAAGYAFGSVYSLPDGRRRRTMLALGLSATIAFVVVRTINGYGDAAPWSVQADAARTAMSFLNVTKYPPSLLYLLMTLGPMLVTLWAFERWPSTESRVLVTFGRVPLFAYVAHLLIAHVAAVATAAALGRDPRVLLDFPFFYPADWGFSLPVVYAAWLLVLLVLYPACRWFDGVKRSRTDWWLRYL